MELKKTGGMKAENNRICMIGNVPWCTGAVKNHVPQSYTDVVWNYEICVPNIILLLS